MTASLANDDFQLGAAPLADTLRFTCGSVNCIAFRRLPAQI